MKRLLTPLAIVAVAVAAAVVTGRGDGREERATYRFAVAVRNVDQPVHVTAPRNEQNNL
jgi:hypothetical protein